MKRHFLFFALAAFCGLCVSAYADDQAAPAPVPEASDVPVVAAPSDPAPPPFAQAVPDAERIGGPITTHRKKDSLYWEIGPEQYNSDYIIIMSLARGIGTSYAYGGQSLDYGDDMIWRFKKVGDRVQIIRRNYRYRADSV